MLVDCVLTWITKKVVQWVLIACDSALLRWTPRMFREVISYYKFYFLNRGLPHSTVRMEIRGTAGMIRRQNFLFVYFWKHVRFTRALYW